MPTATSWAARRAPTAHRGRSVWRELARARGRHLCRLLDRHPLQFAGGSAFHRDRHGDRFRTRHPRRDQHRHGPGAARWRLCPDLCGSRRRRQSRPLWPARRCVRRSVGLGFPDQPDGSRKPEISSPTARPRLPYCLRARSSRPGLARPTSAAPKSTPASSRCPALVWKTRRSRSRSEPSSSMAATTTDRKRRSSSCPASRPERPSQRAQPEPEPMPASG